jgi:hypothetical protein
MRSSPPSPSNCWRRLKLFASFPARNTTTSSAPWQRTKSWPHAEIRSSAARLLSTRAAAPHNAQSRHFDRAPLTSGLPRLADILRVIRHVAIVPISEVASLKDRWNLFQPSPVDSVDNHNCLETAPVWTGSALTPWKQRTEDNHDLALFTACYRPLRRCRR